MCNGFIGYNGTCIGINGNCNGPCGSLLVIGHLLFGGLLKPINPNSLEYVPKKWLKVDGLSCL